MIAGGDEHRNSHGLQHIINRLIGIGGVSAVEHIACKEDNVTFFLAENLPNLTGNLCQCPTQVISVTL